MRSERFELALKLLALGLVAHAAYWALAYAGQPLLDLYGFRQAQTAISAYWLGKDGFSLAYQTPVSGPPWNIPFELPLYQWLAVRLAGLGGWSLDVTGRLLSFAFLLACLWPLRAAQQRLKLPTRAFWVAVAVAFSSPTYIYWGRAFMIETLALFLALACLPVYLDILLKGMTLRRSLALALLASLSLLQKATTGLPVLALLGVIHLGALLRGHERRLSAWLLAALPYALPLALMAAWTRHADGLKELTPLGKYLTSKALGAWNWGSLAQRQNPALWRVNFGQRLFEPSLAGWLGAGLLGLGLVLARAQKRSLLLCALLGMGLLPPLLFWNLHFVHTYYQVANAIFLGLACAVVLGEMLPAALGKAGPAAALCLTTLLVLANLAAFKRDYAGPLSERFDPAKTPLLQAASQLKRSLPEDTAFVSFGLDWSSELPYYAQRKCLCAPDWLPDLDKLKADPAIFVAPAKLGALVVAVSPYANETQREAARRLRQRYDGLPGWTKVDLGPAEGPWRIYLAPGLAR